MGQVIDGTPSADGAADFAIRVYQSDGVPVVSAAGAIDLETAPKLAEALADAQARATSYLIDLSAVDFLSSAGLSVLVEATQQAHKAGLRLAIVITSRTVLRAIEVTQLDSVLSIFGTDSEASAFLLAT